MPDNEEGFQGILCEAYRLYESHSQGTSGLQMVGAGAASG